LYGFIEKWLADILEIEYHEFGLNDGSAAALITKSKFEEIYSVVTKLWEEDGDPEELRPREISSDVSGVKILFHKYWKNENILYGLTDGPTKNIREMLAFATLPLPRFLSEGFNERIKSIYKNMFNHAEASDNLAISEEREILEEQEESESVENLKPTEEELFLDLFKKQYNLYNFTEHSSTNKRIFLQNNFSKNFNDLVYLAGEIDKNIILINSHWDLSLFSLIKKQFKFSDIAKHTIIILANPTPSNGFFKPSISNIATPICFGEKVFELNLLKGDDIKNSINNDFSLSEIEKERKINLLENDPAPSIYSKFDYIFKDTCTNVIWALKDRCFLFMTFDVEKNSNNLFKKCIIEFGRRFDGNNSIEELNAIDKEYQKEISKKYEKEYIDFAVSSSNALIDQMKKDCEVQSEKYREHFQKAMEHGKIMTRLIEQIEAFDQKEFEKAQRKKATETYIETMKIPDVLSINVEQNIINVYTKNLYAQDERTLKWHDIGTFHIQIGMLSNSYDQDSTVKILNTKHQIKGLQTGMQAPHVFSNGTICHGSLISGMIEAYKRRDLFQLVYQLILFLQTANTDDSAGKYINQWPEVTEKIAIGELSYNELKNNLNENEKKFDEMLAEAIPVNV